MKNITISHIRKAYEDKQALSDFSATLEAGKITALMAPSGSGKTTLLRILLGLETADSGDLKDLEGLKIRAVFQEDRLCLPLNPVDNIRLADSSITRAAAEEALRAVGLTDCLNQPVRELSGGMRRRVAITRALLCDYDLLLMDEPFRGLDQDTKALVMEDTRKRCQGHTVLLVTHDDSELPAMGVQNCISL